MDTKAILSLFLCLNALGVAKGAVTYVSQNRFVSASNTRGSSASSHAAGLSPFSAAASVSWESPAPPELAEHQEWARQAWELCHVYVTGASQTSTLTTRGMALEGMAYEDGPFINFENLIQSSSSYFEVSFATTHPQRFALTGVLDAWGDYGGTTDGDKQSWVRLSDQHGEIFTAGADGVDVWNGSRSQPISLDKAIFLDPGRYTLSAGAVAEGRYWGDDPYTGGVGEGGSANYRIRLAPVPAPGAILLGGIGIASIGWVRWRRVL